MIGEMLCRESMENIIRTARLNRRVVEGVIHELGVHHSQHVLLMFLSKQEEMPSQREIAEKFDISPAAVAVTIKKLERGGYIEKNTAQEDGRYHEIGLTAKGRDVVERSKELFRKIHLEIFDGFCEQDLEQLQKMLVRMQCNLKKLEQRHRKDEII